MSLYGNFTSINILKIFFKLQSLTICSLSNVFSIYDLNSYKNLYNIIACLIISSSREYITGKDLNFLKKCNYFGIVLLENVALRMDIR